MKALARRFFLNAFVVAVSLALSLVLARGAVRALCLFYGAGASPVHEYELGARLWRPDAYCGYRNRPFADEMLFGGVAVKTDAMGFRAEKVPAGAAPCGGPPVLGMGDSVSWGAGVNAEETFLGILGRRLGAGARVLNAAVVGYSTLQEAALLEKLAPELRPRVVIVNFCPNDFIPTENPFGNLAGIYAGLADGGYGEESGDLCRYLGGKLSASDLALKMESDALYRKRIFERFIRLPIRDMSLCARRYGFRLVYALIPFGFEKTRPEAYRAAISAMRENGVDYIDFFDVLKEGGGCRKLKDFGETSAGRAVRLLDGIMPGFYRDFERLGMARGLSYTQRRCNFLDRSGHLTKMGHEKVAEALFELIGRGGAPPKKPGA